MKRRNIFNILKYMHKQPVKRINMLFFSMLVSVVLLFSACGEDFITKDPYGDISKDKALSNYEKIALSTTGLYEYLMSSSMYGEFIPISPDVTADNLKSSVEGATGRYRSNYLLNFTPANAPSGVWSTSYAMITAACNIINTIEEGGFDRQNDSDNQVNQLLGEALFIRALGHFTLVNFFAHHYTMENASLAPGANGQGGHIGVPIILTAQIGEPARNSVKEVYDQVIDDLSRAATLMTEHKTAFFASSNVAKALLSRVYLYKEDWANAAKMADEVIASADYMLTMPEAYEGYWKKELQLETIFEVSMNLSDPWFPGGNNNVGGVYLFYHDLAATDQVVNLYEADDVRRNVLKPNSSGEHLVYKYPGREGTEGFQVNHTKVIRLAEMYLNRAEANQRNNSEIGDSPLNDINYLRQMRGLDALDDVDNAAIALERRKELAFEGFRLFDLARYQQDNQRPECLPVPLVEYPASRYVYPIPLHEMDNNDNMEQNP